MTASPADEALMLRFQDQGDAAAFETLFRRHKDAFVSFLWRLSGNESAAEEVSQQCWLKLIELARERRYRAVAGSRFRTWLYTLGRNLYIDRYVRSHGETRRQPLDVLEKVPEGIARADPFAEAARGPRYRIPAPVQRKPTRLAARRGWTADRRSTWPPGTAGTRRRTRPAVPAR